MLGIHARNLELARSRSAEPLSAESGGSGGVNSAAGSASESWVAPASTPIGVAQRHRIAHVAEEPDLQPPRSFRPPRPEGRGFLSFIAQRSS